MINFKPLSYAVFLERMLRESVEKDIIIVVQNTRPKFCEELRILIEEEII